MISIIIPTLNEEKYLGKLLKSIKEQGRDDVEIIVADADSQDKTPEIAKKYGCKVVKGGLPAVGRNAGAKAAKGDILIFADADVVFPNDFFKKGLLEFEERKLEVASVMLNLEGRSFQLRMDIFYNIPILLLEKILPHGAMTIIVRKKIFNTVGGFDESVMFAEDLYFVREAAKKGKFGILRSIRILTTPRRYLKDGAFSTYVKFILVEFYMFFLGPVRSDIFKYRFDHYHKE
ncbi:MAG: glycosyltransferase [Patescibacteria group bacterium]|nr:glycosyltransferase [Patescibacteria group bacterium]